MKLFYLLFVLSFKVYAGPDFLPDHFSFNFKEVYLSSVSGKEKESKGSLDYSFPGKIRLEIMDDDKSIFISDGKTSWYYTPPFIEGEKGELVERPANQVFLPEFFDALKNGLKTNDLYSVTDKKEYMEIIFKKKLSSKLGKKMAKLYFSNPKSKKLVVADLEKITFVDQQAKETYMVLSDFSAKKSFPDRHFFFDKTGKPL